MNNMRWVVSFLGRLKRNNNRRWFEKNRMDYDRARQTFEDFVFEIIQNVQLFDDSIGHPEPRDCIFRIYRDVRFSKDKSPYKTNFGAVIAPEGRKTRRACYYVQVSPGEHMLGGGVYMPEANQLKRLRRHVLSNGEEFERLMAKRSFRDYFGGLWDEDKLSRVPRGFDPQDPYVELAKNRHFVVSHSFTNREVLSAGFVKSVSKGFRLMKDFNDFLNQVK